MVDYDVPFFPNTEDKTHCFQAALKMVLKYFLPEQEYSFEELDRISQKEEGKWTWPLAGMLWMAENGFEIRNIDIFDLQRFSNEGEKYLIEFFGDAVAGEQIAHTNVARELENAKHFVAYSEQRVPTAEDLKRLLEGGYLAICNINSRVLNDRDGYSGHFVVVKGFNESGLIINDPGPPPLDSRQVDFDLFEKAWGYPNEEAKNIIAIRLKK